MALQHIALGLVVRIGGLAGTGPLQARLPRVATNPLGLQKHTIINVGVTWASSQLHKALTDPRDAPLLFIYALKNLIIQEAADAGVLLKVPTFAACSTSFYKTDRPFAGAVRLPLSPGSLQEDLGVEQSKSRHLGLLNESSPKSHAALQVSPYQGFPTLQIDLPAFGMIIFSFSRPFSQINNPSRVPNLSLTLYST